ncbi:GlcG/HbpS family heme-binding protein [Flavobacterium sp. 2]|uniref:GlcG/HbpS family heme-binding protein n=1 Tax=Flavobacterium sp. 2 TaxID=308053 RepID=UPI003CEF949B
MNEQTIKAQIALAFAEIEKLIPEYLQIEEDKRISNGNVAVCIIDENGSVHGKMYGNDKARQRQSYKIAWTKASQVWLTGVKTGEYEKMVFNGIVDENANGIEAPDLIGWQGGQPITLSNGTKLSIGFSGFRGTTDLEIAEKAFEQL